MKKQGILERLADYTIANVGGEAIEDEMAVILANYETGKVSFESTLVDILYGEADANHHAAAWGVPCGYPIADVARFLAEIAE